MPAACALGIISGKIIFNFEIAERLRTLRYLIFTGGVVKETGICGYPPQAQSRKEYAHFPTKSGLVGRAKQCIVRKNGFASCKTAANALFYNHSLPL